MSWLKRYWLAVLVVAVALLLLGLSLRQVQESVRPPNSKFFENPNAVIVKEWCRCPTKNETGAEGPLECLNILGMTRELQSPIRYVDGSFGPTHCQEP